MSIAKELVAATLPNDITARLKVMERVLGEKWLNIFAILHAGDVRTAVAIAIELLKALPPGNSRDFVGVDTAKPAPHLLHRICCNEVIIELASYVQPINRFDQELTQIFSLAADAGIPDYAYNAGIYLSKHLKTPAEYDRAIHYFEIALAESDDPSNKASALVNMAPLKGGHPSLDLPDWEVTVACYEEAAQLGLVIGAFNLANMLYGQVELGHEQHVERSIQWFEAALAKLDSGEPLLERDNPEVLPSLKNHSFLLLGNLLCKHGKTLAEVERGIDLLRSYDQVNRRENEIRMNGLIVGIERKMRLLNRPKTNTPANNLRFILDSMGWKVGEVQPLGESGFECMKVDMGEGESIPLVVINQPLVSDALSENARSLYSHIQGAFETFLVTGSSPMLKDQAPDYVWSFMYCSGEAREVVTLNPVDPPKKLINERHIARREILRGIFLASAVNNLNAGHSIEDSIDLDVTLHSVIGTKWFIPSVENVFPGEIII